MGSLPKAIVDPPGYKHLLQRERMQKPALITHRKAILEKMQRDQYRNEFERIQGELEAHAQRFSTPGGHWEKDKLTNRLKTLKKLFHDTHHPEKHPIEK